MSYCALADLKIYQGISALTTDDVLLQKLIDAAQSAIDTHCNRTFEASADSTRYFDALRDVDQDDYLTLYLDRDLCAITSVTNGDGTAITSTKYVTEPRNYSPWYALKLKPNSGIAWTYTTDPENAIVIVGRWAWSTSAPAAIVQACTRLAVWLYKQKDNSADNSADRPIMSSSGTVLLPSRLPTDVTDLIAPFKRRVA